MNPHAELLRTLHFAAAKHRDHRRKDPEASPYINHPIEVTEVLVRVGGIDRIEVLQAALLHDTIEDTDTSAEELEEEFGFEVRKLVEEVTDDKSLPKQERKRLQIERAPGLSDSAKRIKLADKACNVRDITNSPPPDWSNERRAEYFSWSREVIAGCRGVSEALEREFDAACVEAEAVLRRTRSSSG